MSIRIEIDGLEQLQGRLAAMGTGLDREVDEALVESAGLVAKRVERNAPKRSRRMAGSVEVFTEGATAGVRVTARRVSRRYPGGYPYPQKVEYIRPFLAPAVKQESKRIEDRMRRALDWIQGKWGGA